MASDSSTRPANGFLVFLGSGALFIGVAVVAIGVLALNSRGGETLEQKRAAQRVETAARLEKEAQEKLNSTGWVDKAKGVVHAPVADVLPIVVAELKARKPAPSQVKVEPPLPMPVIDPKATEPPPPAFPSAPQGADNVRFSLPVADAAPTAAPQPAPPAPAPAAPAPAPAPAPQVTPPAPAPAVPTPAPAPQVTPPAPAPAAPAPTPATPVPSAAPTPPSPAPAAPAPPPVPVQPAPTSAAPPVPAPAPPAPAEPVANPAPPAPARPPLINPTENSEPTK